LVLAPFIGPGCDDDDDDDPGEEEATECRKVGQNASCVCDNGAIGIKVCTGDGTYTECDCFGADPDYCPEPGVAYECPCGGGARGTRICVYDHTFTPCDCPSTGTPAAAGAGGGGQPPSVGGIEVVAQCPSGFTCMDQMGFRICADSTGIPPLCQTPQDCADQGLPGAQCMDPDVGATVCILLCQ
jgi:hypothetical protein